MKRGPEWIKIKLRQII